MKNYISLWIQGIIVLFLLGGVGLYFYAPDSLNRTIFGERQTKTNKKRSRRSNRIAPVIVSKVIQKTNDNVIEAIGDGRAARSITLFSESPGEIVQIKVRAGDHVKKDDIILKLNDKKTLLSLQVAQTRLTEAERKYQRANQLYQRKVVAKANVDDAKTEFNRFKLEYKQAQLALNDRTLKAPFSGVVGIPKVELGDRIATNTAIITLDDRTSLRVEFEIPELFHSRVKVGQSIVSQTPSFTGKTFKGKIKSIDSRVNATTRSVTVRAEIANTDDTLRPGMSFLVKIVIPGKAHPAIPELALQWGNGESYVWLVKDGKAIKTKVRMVKRVNSSILVEGNLSNGDLIVVEGVQRLRDGIKVKYSSSKAAEKNVSKLVKSDDR